MAEEDLPDLIVGSITADRIPCGCIPIRCCVDGVWLSGCLTKDGFVADEIQPEE